MAWTDLLGSQEFLAAAPDADALGSYSDALAVDLQIVTATPITVSLDADSMATWDDTPAGILAHNPALTSDWSNLADSTAGFMTHAAALGADDMNGYGEAIIAVAYYRLGHLLVEALPAMTDGMTWEEYGHAGMGDTLINSEGLFAAATTDDWSNLADSTAGFFTYSAGVSDDWSNLSDALSFTLVDLGATPIVVSPDADSMAAWDDTPEGILDHNPALISDWSNLGDSLDNLFSYLASLSEDDLNAWLDQLAVTLAEVQATPLLAAFLDTMAAWDDTPGGMMSHDGSMADDWSQLKDAIKLRLTGGAGVSAPLDTYIIVGLNQGGNQGPSIGAM